MIYGFGSVEVDGVVICCEDLALARDVENSPTYLIDANNYTGKPFTNLTGSNVRILITSNTGEPLHAMRMQFGLSDRNAIYPISFTTYYDDEIVTQTFSGIYTGSGNISISSYQLEFTCVYQSFNY